MKNSLQRLFDIPYYIQKQFGEEHPVFLHATAQGIVSTTAKQYVQRSIAFRNFLLDRGLRKGHRVISIIGNSPDYNFVEMGILAAGGIHVPLSALYNAAQLQSIFE